MRPVRLTMTAFGPFAGREVVDFRDALNAGLFGIYGQTGAGKSTIFSAMTFALFGEAARGEQEASSLRSDHADPGTLTEVEFVFDLGAERFVIVRRPEQMRPARRGGGETRDLHEAFLFDATGVPLDEITDAVRGRVIAEKKVRDVNDAVRARLGYGAEQFRQVVLLPQGRFEAFLTAKSSERQKILRDLFDVRLYGQLTERLKVAADDARRRVREDRDICRGRLAAEDVEDLTALEAAIVASEALRVARRAAAETAQQVLTTARAVLEAGQETARRFALADETARHLAGLAAAEADMAALSVRIAKAESVRALMDIKAQADSAGHDLTVAEQEMERCRRAARQAEAAAATAAAALERESARSGELADLVRQIDDFDRYAGALAEAAGPAEALARSRQTVTTLAERLAAADAAIRHRQREAAEQLAAWKSAEATDARRRGLTADLAVVEAERRLARDHAAAAVSLREGQAALDRYMTSAQAAQQRLEAARAAHEAAERLMASSQAAHLAMRLQPGEPCPVCGSAHHPAPATGEAAAAGPEQPLRPLKAALEAADRDLRAATEAVASGRGMVDERRTRLATLSPPERPMQDIEQAWQAVRGALEDLGAPVDAARLQAGLDRHEAELRALIVQREALQTEHAAAQMEVVAGDARVVALLSSVPAALRDRVALSAARARAVADLAARQAARDAADRQARAGRDGHLSALKDVEAAEARLAACRARHDDARAGLAQRLAEAGLTQADLLARIPALATLDADRQRLAAYRAEVTAAELATQRAAEAITGAVRPDVPALQADVTAADGAHLAAVEARTAAQGRTEQLRRLHEDVAAALLRADAAEAASAPLRDLAALAAGDNPQKLTLETYALGAMFDRVLGAANLRLGPMTGQRYALERDVEGTERGGRRGLGIQVFDEHTGKARPSSTLSGGETFIVALALALGLADVVESASGQIRLDTIFIDEGFGSLDAENGSGTLEQVLQVLGRLVRQNRAVGVISHVAQVKDAIPDGFQVVKTARGSHIELRDGRG